MAKKESKSENKVKKHFLKDFKAELKKVIWPTPKQLVNNTVAVVTIVLITAAIVFVLDVIFDMGNKYGISHLQSIVDEKYNSEEENTENTDSSDNGEENMNGEESSDETTDDTTTEGENVVTDEADTAEQSTENNQASDETTADGEQTNPEQ